MSCLVVLMLNTCDGNYNKVLTTLDSADWQTGAFWWAINVNTVWSINAAKTHLTPTEGDV